MLFQLLQEHEDARPGSRNWEGDDFYNDDEYSIIEEKSLFPKVNITWKVPKETITTTASEHNTIIFGVRGVGSCYVHANFKDSTVVGATSIEGITSTKETTLALEKDTLGDVAPSEAACLLCRNARLSCWVVCCQAAVPAHAARCLAETIISALSDNNNNNSSSNKVTEVHAFDSYVVSLYRSPSRERAVPPMLRAVSFGVSLPEGCCTGLETPNIVEGVGAAIVNHAYFSGGKCVAAVYVTLVETAFVEPRALEAFNPVVASLFPSLDVAFANESELKKVLRKITWASPSHLFA